MNVAQTASVLAAQWRRGEVSAVLTALDDMARNEAIAVAVAVLHCLDSVEDSAPAARFMLTLAALT